MVTLKHIMPPADKPGSVCHTIETLIDRTSLVEVLTAIECICSQKAEHLRVNWQDNATAKHWDKASNLVADVTRRVTV